MRAIDQAVGWSQIVSVMDLSSFEWRDVWKSKLHLGNGVNVCDGMILIAYSSFLSIFEKRLHYENGPYSTQSVNVLFVITKYDHDSREFNI